MSLKELPQPRPYGAQGRKPTHDFLSLYSPVQQDPSSSTPPGGFLETHDFLQPLEGNKFEEPPIRRSQPPAPEHVLPGGIGTYSISHSQSQRVAKSKGVVITAAQSSGSDKNDENLNCSSYTGSGFSLWEESAVNKGKTGKENIAGNTRVIRERGMKTGGVPWMTSMEWPSQSSSAHNHPTTTMSSLSSSRPSSAPKNPSFVDTLKSAKSSQDYADDEQQEFVIKEEPSSHYKGVFSVKVDTSHHDQKPNTPRSKHSATEHRRRSKINDRFSMLRGITPHGDQKRDKASFLLEVIEYIRFLQEKVHKYEDSCQNNNNNQRPTEGFIDQPLVKTIVSEPALVNMGNVSLNHPKKGQTRLDSDLSSHEQIGQQPLLTNKGSSFPLPLQSNIYSPASLPSTLAAESANTTSRLWQTGSYTNDCAVAGDKLIDQEGTISISTIYSQGLLGTLTQALQNSGVDLSQANISVQVNVGKTPILKRNEVTAIDETLTRARLASTREEKNSLKRLKTN
ncbi:hypothetical protein L1987_53164 [Smallanthus sonchifolius]|uniref:Uncharacterized protein n=1 Tax=Smallanthus sonchifolius TaxID=185202 RepID=A0ACB9EVW9_9ASTR|nr:hypothetical protein L1987_53164 [Smallanthus sonchifolius]